MSVVVEMTGVTTTAGALPTGASCTVALDTSDIRSGVREGDKQAPSACRSTSPRPPNGLTFARRRHSKTVDSPYLSRPRMKRRGAVSYDKNDAAAEYIRYLGRCKTFVCLIHEIIEGRHVHVPICTDTYCTHACTYIYMYNGTARHFAGDTLNQHGHVQTHTRLAELPANKCEYCI